MKFRKFPILLSVSAVLFSAGWSQATTLGVTNTPAGAAWVRGSEDSAYAIFDSFPSTSFSDVGPDSSSGMTGALVDQSSTFTNFGMGAGVYDYVSSPFVTGDDVINTGGNALSFTVEGTTSFAIGGVYLSIKRANTQDGAFATRFSPLLSLDGGTSWLSPATPTTATGSGDTTGSTGYYAVTSWYWAGQALTDFESGEFLISFGAAAGHNAVDAITVDASAVPEPSTWMMMLGGVGAVLWLKSRRVSKA